MNPVAGNNVRRELDVPQEALSDDDSFELLRVWAAHQKQHVTIRSELRGGPGQIGVLIADLARHGARLYAQRTNSTQSSMLTEILKEMKARRRDESLEYEGSIGLDG